MPFLRATAALAAFVSLAACEALTGPEAPSVSYSYDYIGNYGIVESRAALFCAQEHGTPIVLRNQRITSSGYDVTFDCKPGLGAAAY